MNKIIEQNVKESLKLCGEKKGILTSLEEPPSATRTCILLPPPGKQVERVNQSVKQTHV